MENANQCIGLLPKFGQVKFAKMKNCSVVDIFCGAGGLTHGFVLEGFQVTAGVDADPACQYAFEANNEGAIFIQKQIEEVTAEEILALYPEGHAKILVGCAPCQPYSNYTKKQREQTTKWRLLPKFANLICEVEPDIISMENVPDLINFKKGKIFQNFVSQLEAKGYSTSYKKDIYCPDYGIPQHRTRLVFFASKFGKLEILPETHTPDTYKTVQATIGHLEALEAGQTSANDPLHKVSELSDLNLRRIRASEPGGTWRDWSPELVAACHKKNSGRGYASVYGRMRWDEPSPTITTQFYGFGNGRFGHPEQDRAISLREGALLQTFPADYQFIAPETPYYIKTIGRLIGNAVPVDLGRVIAKSIKHHLATHLN